VIPDSLPDIPRVLTGLAQWCACLVYLFVLAPRRGSRRRMVVAGALALPALVGMQLLAGEMPLVLWPLGMAASVVLMFAFVWLSTGASASDAGYVTARTLVLAEFVASLHWQLHCFFFAAAPAPTTPLQVSFVVLAYGVSFGGVHLVERRDFPQNAPLNVRARELLLSLAIAVATFVMSNLSFVSTTTPFSGRLGPEIFYIRTLVDLAGFVALYSQQSVRMETRALAELSAIDQVLRSQHEQYLQSKRSIDAVNRTYHDLKHQIAVIRAEGDPLRKRAYLDELETSIRDHESHYHTGNGVLDVILTSKDSLCAERGIELTAVADGAALGFMSVMDITALFGNALDNAIEATDAVEDPDKRLIRLALFVQSDLVMIVVENYFPGTLHVEHGELTTTKPDRQRHGYGLKSIRHTAEKYGGSMTFGVEDGWFRLRILVPMPDDPSGRGGPHRDV